MWTPRPAFTAVSLHGVIEDVRPQRLPGELVHATRSHGHPGESSAPLSVPNCAEPGTCLRPALSPGCWSLCISDARERRGSVAFCVLSGRQRVCRGCRMAWPCAVVGRSRTSTGSVKSIIYPLPCRREGQLERDRAASPLVQLERQAKRVLCRGPSDGMVCTVCTVCTVRAVVQSGRVRTRVACRVIYHVCVEARGPRHAQTISTTSRHRGAVQMWAWREAPPPKASLKLRLSTF